MEPQSKGPNYAARQPQEAHSETELTSILEDRIKRSREIIAEIDGLVAASRNASETADEQEAERRRRNPVRVAKHPK